MELGLKDRVAIVGGSSSGMGMAIALALAREGTSITICARNEASLRKAELEVARTSSQHHVLAIPADLASSDDIRRVVRGTFNRFGRLDIAVNNLVGPVPEKSFELEDEEWHDDVERHFMSVVRMSREVVPYMKQQQWGRIINRLSMSALMPSHALGGSSSTRMAVVGYTRMLATELAPFNITVNNVLPGSILTDRLTAIYEARADAQNQPAQEIDMEAKKGIPMGRLGKPEEIGDLVAFLASERASYLTGASIPLDGGATQLPM